MAIGNMANHGYLGIDLGTQGLSLIFTDHDMQVLETGEGHYDMCPGLSAGCYEQAPEDWEAALKQASQQLRSKLERRGLPWQVAAIGISGQMHGEVQITDPSGTARPARLWCDSRNEQEEQDLTRALGVKMPKRMTAVRWLWTWRNHPQRAADTMALTTPGGWLAYRLTGQRLLGIGDASGMFPIDQATLDYDQRLIDHYNQLAGQGQAGYRDLRQLLPTVRAAGQDGGALNAHGAGLLGLPEGTPVAPAEGDQPAALAGSLIGQAGTVSMSFGTSVCANSVGDRTFQGVSPAVDHFCAPDGKPINMVWLRNGTTFMNAVVQMVSGQGKGAESSDRAGDPFSKVIPQMLQAAADCQGLLALPFMDDEPGLGVQRGGAALLLGLNETNATPGNAARAALLATTFNLRIGSDLLLKQGYPLTEIVLSGGLTKTPQLGQVVADVFGLPVTILDSAAEGSAWGAALTAKYRALSIDGQPPSWSEFLSARLTGQAQTFQPDSAAVKICQEVFERYKKLLSIHSVIDGALG